MNRFLLIAAGMLVACSFARSQALSCSVNPNELNYRAEGLADLTGDVVIKCNPGQNPVSGVPYLTGDLKIAINTNFTNRLGVMGNANTTDAVLVIDENNAPPAATSTIGGPLKNVPVPQLGVIGLCPPPRDPTAPPSSSSNCLAWTGVQIPVPGATAPDGTSFKSVTTLRITNLRANPIQLGLPVDILLNAVGIADFAQLQGLNPCPPDNPDCLTLGKVKQSLITSNTSASLCANQTTNIVNGAVSGPPTFTVTLREGFSNAFRPLGQPGSSPGIPSGESGYPTGLGAAGGSATQGTRFLFRFNNVGPGTRIAAPGTVSQGSLTLQLLQGTDASGTGSFMPVTSSGLNELQAGAGFLEAVYEVVSSDDTQVESIDVPFTVGYVANPALNTPVPGTVSVNASYAPLTTAFTASSAAPLPRFGDNSLARNAFTISDSCAPPPNITLLNPLGSTAATSVALTVTGTGFVAGSVVEFNGTALTTTSSSDFSSLSAIVSANLLLTPGTVPVDVLNPDGRRSNTVLFTITQPSAAAPSINRSGIVNAASSVPPVSRGSLVSVYGQRFSSGIFSAGSLPLPTQLATTSVAVNGMPAPIIYVSPLQINFQMPFEVPLTGTASVTVTRDNITSSAMPVPLGEFAPGIFRSPTQSVVLHGADNTFVTTAKPAQPSEVLVAYGTGIGGLTALPVTGAATPGSPLISARINPTATVGGQAAAVLFAGLVPGFVGLAQFNIQMPATFPATGTLPLVIAFGNASDSVNIAVSNPAPLQLSVDLKDVIPNTPIAGDHLQLDYVVHAPHSFSGTLTHDVFFSKNSKVSASDQLLGSNDHSKSLDDQSWTFSGLNMPNGTTPGQYYVAAGVTLKGDTDPTHIALSGSLPITVLAQRPPFDLSVTLTKITPTTVAAGSPVTVSYSVSEPSGISGTFFRSIYIGPQSKITANDTLINTRVFDMVNGTFTLDSVNNIIPSSLAPGNYWVAVIVQNDGDTNPSNNISVALPITVTASDAGAPSTNQLQQGQETQPELKPGPGQDKGS